MVIEVQDRNVTLDEATREWIERRIQFALARFAGRIRRVQVVLNDVNGHRGGMDKQCQVRLTLIPTGEIVVEDLDSTLEAATANSVERAARSMARWLVRQREFGDGSEMVQRNPGNNRSID
jgi:ribosome-associated translation inhibitor RaiA